MPFLAVALKKVVTEMKIAAMSAVAPKRITSELQLFCNKIPLLRDNVKHISNNVSGILKTNGNT